MTRAPAALVIAVVLSAPQTSTAELCAPRAELGGDSVAVERVGDELRRLGVTIAPAGTTPGCPTVKAVVELDRGGGIAVAVRGAAQRSEGRVVSDATVAAAWIDSWLRDDLEVASWVTAAPVIARVAEPAPVLTPRDVPVTPAATDSTVLERFGLSALYEQAWSSDGSSWSGGSVAGCVVVGGVCIGGRVRAAFEPRLVANATAAERSDLSALATVSLPVDAGQMRFVPELGLGVGRFTTKRLDGCKVEMAPPMTCDPNDPMCVMPIPEPTCEAGTDPTGVYVGDGLDESSYTPRLAAALRVTVPLFRHVWLDGLASFTLAPFGHRADYDDATAPQPNMLAPGSVAIPGEPASSYQLGIGLRIGAP